ncbi:hypothetical protein, partial [Candidatus Ichthyocystis sparus]|uniref:hypothetical protein n=1 Tax=Candidatus Ichthyocystis sparus TaxID=1561004 RepID=UPI001F5E8F4F
VLPGCALMIKDLFSKVGALASDVYEDMVRKQLPPEISDKLSVTERAIWYRTYKATCEVGFVSRCFGEYHAEHRPGFVLSLSKIQVLSDTKGNLLDFLLELDRAIRREMESIFNSCWSEVSVSLEEESLSSISCRNFVKVLDVAGIPALVSSSTRVESSTKERGSKGKRVASATSVVDLTHSSPPSSQSLPSQSSSQLGSSLPSGETSSAPPELTPSIAAKRHKGSDSVPVTTHAEVGTVCTTALGVTPVSTEASTPTSSSVSSSGASLSVQCVDLLDVKLHPDSAKLICGLFFVLRGSAKKCYSNVLGHLLSTVSSELSAVGRAVWCRTYRELHLLSFMARCLCLYHSKCRPDFIRSLAGIRVLSGSSGRSLVPLSGGELLSFLSKLDCAIRDEVESIFSLEWDRVADSVFAELEDGSLGDVGCEDLVNIFDAVSSPVVAFPIYQGKKYQRREVGKGKTLGSGSKCIEEGTGSVTQKCFVSKSGTLDSGKCAEVTESGSSTSDLTYRLVQHELSSQPESESLPKRHLRSGTTLGSLLLLKESSGQSSSGFVKSLFYRHEPATATASTVISSTPAILLAPLSSSLSTSESHTQSGMKSGFLVSTVEGAASDLVGEDELHAPAPIVASDIPPYLPPLAEELVEVSVVSALRGVGDDSLSPSSSPSIGPSSSPSIGTSSPSLSSSPSELGLDADVSSSSAESVSNREIVGSATEVIVSESGVLVGESTPVCSSEQPIVPITASSSVSISSIGEPSTAVSSSSSGYVHGLKKAFAMRFKGPFEVSTTSNVVAEPSSSISMSSSVVSGTSSSAPVGVGSVPPVAAATDTIAEDVGVRLAALLNRDLPPSPPPASGSMRGARGRLSSSHRGSAQRGRGRKRKRNS